MGMDARRIKKGEDCSCNNQKNQSTFITLGNKENVTDTFIDPISPYTIT
jgi:hypothetical protein